MKFCCSSFLLSVSLGVAGCASSAVGITQYGEMRPVLRDGQTEPRVALADVVRTPHAYAVGALAGLAGEITIVDGAVWVARAADGDLAMSGPDLVASDQATLLTLGYVPAWRDIVLTEASAGSDLEAAISRAAHRIGLDTSTPFAFVVQATLTQLDAHVIAGVCPMSGAAGPDPWRVSLDEAVDATLIGFYAEDAAGVITHHGSAVHMHVLLERDGRTVTAHVEDVVVGPGAVLRLPAR